MNDSGTTAATEAVPGLAPGGPHSAGTLFGALYGTLTPHPWRDPDSDQDLYSAFHTRSSAMGWLDDRGVSVRRTEVGSVETPTGGPGLWVMHDAGEGIPAPGRSSTPVAWFQVGVSSLAADRPLPVQAFLRCAVDATEQLGVLTLESVQLLLPVDGLHRSATTPPPGGPSLATADWFDDRDPLAATRVTVSVDSGRRPWGPHAAARLAEQLSAANQPVFRCDPGRHHADPVLPPPFDESFWEGPTLHTATFHGTLVEWTADAIGWLGGFLSDLSSSLGATGPVLLTVRRGHGEDPEGTEQPFRTSSV